MIYEDARALREKGLIGSIVYGGVSRTGTMQKLHYLTRKGAVVLAEAEGIEMDTVKYPKSTNTLVKNDFSHRIATISMMIAFDKRLGSTTYEKLFFDVYFDMVGSQRKQVESALRSKTRMQLDEQHFIDPDGIFAFEGDGGARLFVLEVANGHDTKRVVEQIRRNLFASYTGLVGDKYGIKQTATVFVVFDRQELMKGTIKRVIADPQLQKFEGIDKYLFFGLQQEVKNGWASHRANIYGEHVDIFG